jgi:hypothetical protein
MFFGDFVCLPTVLSDVDGKISNKLCCYSPNLCLNLLFKYYSLYFLKVLLVEIQMYLKQNYVYIVRVQAHVYLYGICLRS